jgi:polyisoprenoid-binding protein YceI/CheY-like chemotaxis protein
LGYFQDMKPLRVLMLVADPERRDDLATLLRRASHQVETIPDAAAASDSLRDPVADTLVLDLASPDLDLTALRRAISPAEAIEPESLDAAERQHLARVLRFTDGNKRKAALLLGISRSTLLNKVRKYALLIGGACLLPMVAPPLASQEPRSIPAGQVTSGTLSFDGHASVGDFVGRTSTVSGQITGGADLSAVRGWVQAPVKTLTTENGRRDKDLNKSMESDKYPNIRFELSGITPRAGSDDSVRVTLQGKLLIHGVTKPVSLPATLHFEGSKARVRSDFPLSLKEYRIGGLSKMLGVLKMYDDIEVHVDLLFGLASPPS